MFKFLVTVAVALVIAGIAVVAQAEPGKICRTVEVVQVFDAGAMGTDGLVKELQAENPGAVVEVGRCAGALSVHPDVSCVRIVRKCPAAAVAKTK